ncbi:MAG TPA: hypothetical protein VHO25_04790, partial [Polyangiaceae bacterium]|nr:hypothetical protein [Polyangiaceae bacterium]
GDEAQFNADGFEDYSDGAITSTLESEAIVPVAGQEVRLLDALLAKKNLDIGAGIVDGQILTTSMRILKCEYKGTTKDGTLVGSFSFGGGVPKVTG